MREALVHGVQLGAVALGELLALHNGVPILSCQDELVQGTLLRTARSAHLSEGLSVAQRVSTNGTLPRAIAPA
eukprot:10736145-Alexandrium_andersonii.AAC.1